MLNISVILFAVAALFGVIILAALVKKKETPKPVVYLHGLAGDLAAEELSMESMIAGDITKFLGKAYKNVAEI